VINTHHGNSGSHAGRNSSRRLRILKVAAFSIFSFRLIGQTTQGSITGIVRAAGMASPEAYVFYCRIADNGAIYERNWTHTDKNGNYVFPVLSSGRYRLRAQLEPPPVPGQPAPAGSGSRSGNSGDKDTCFPEPPTTAPGPGNQTSTAPARFQAQERHDLTLAVAAWMQVDFDLRPSQADARATSYLTPRGSIIRYFGADDRVMKSISVDTAPASEQTGGSTVSYTIDTDQLNNLPLSGQNVYQLLSFQPGVTSVLTVNGQRSSLFLLDGIEGAPAFGPEFIQEYRVSTGNYSAEFGRSTGFIANAITMSGSNRFHGLLYSYLNHEVLNANAFQSNFRGFPRQRYREVRTGFWSGGPLVPSRTFFSVGFEWYRSRTSEYPFTFRVPVLANFKSCPLTANSQAVALLERFPPPLAPAPPGPPCENLSTPHTVSEPVAINRGLGLIHLDQLLRNGKDHVTLRGIANLETDPYAIFSLYKDFISANKSDVTSLALEASFVRPTVATDFRVGWSRYVNSLPRAHPKIPELSTNTDGDVSYTSGVIALPGVSAGIATNRTRQDVFQLADSTTVSRAGNIVSFGAGMFASLGNSDSAYPRSGTYQFDSLLNFGQDLATYLTLPVSRQTVTEGLPPAQPPSVQDNHRFQFFGFVQDNVRLTPRLAIDFGLRYDYFGAPQYRSAQDAWIPVGPGPIQDALRNAQFMFGSGCCRSSYNSDFHDWGPRIGVSWDFGGSANYVFRAAWGLFYDGAPGAASTLSNTLESATLVSPSSDMKVDYSQPPLNQFLQPSPPQNQYVQHNPSLPLPVLFAPGLASPRVQTWFAGLQHPWSSRITTELNYSGSSGRRLLTTDLVNRTDPHQMDSSRLAPSLLSDVAYASNSGYSSYNAFTSLLRFRSRPLLLQASYTLSHSIDNGGGYFTRQFDTELDRGNSDFDQRQNLVLYAIAELPALERGHLPRLLVQGWRLAALMGFRSGFPYSVYANTNGMKACSANAAAAQGTAVLFQNRASLVPGATPEVSPPVPVPGGVKLLNQDAFCYTPTTAPGTLGRNGFTGPGFRNLDASLAKSFPLPWLGEASSVQFRADFFNLLNHPNLGNPLVGQAAFGQFGQAFFGVNAAPPGNVSFVPLDEIPRRIQLQVRVRF
jgi:hypothetical protein